MSVFNKDSRTKNAIKTSAIGGATNIIKILLGFGYRTLFVFIFSEVYLGINGLFTNILQILSLAELGITTAIVYRFYEPISRDDVHYVGMLMNFFGRVYRLIALSILGIGCCFIPLLPHLINSSDQLPEDINLYVIYILFLINTVASYVFSYKMTILSADQKNYVTSVIDLIQTVVRYAVQIIALYQTKDFTITLFIGIIATLLLNFICSLWTEHQYKEVFIVKEMLPREDQKLIFEDTRACMYHKIGGTVLNSTDSVVLTKMVSLAMTGIYSNYSMLLTYIQQFIGQILGNFTASVGNAIQKMSDDDYYMLFKKINFLGLWTASIVSVGVYGVIDDFIRIWLGDKYVLDSTTTTIVVIQLFITLSKITSGAFTNAAGLFVMDKIRPLIEAVLNLVISIILTFYMGISGVFLGTIISMALTVCWREPYLLYKYSFKRSVFDYWKIYLMFSGVSVMAGLTIAAIRPFIEVNSFGAVILEGVAVEVAINLVLIGVFFRSEEFRGLKGMLMRLLKK